MSAECDKVDAEFYRCDFVGHLHLGTNLFDCNVDDFWIGVRDSGENFSIIRSVRNNT